MCSCRRIQALPQLIPFKEIPKLTLMMIKRASGFPAESLGEIPGWADIFDGALPKQMNRTNTIYWFGFASLFFLKLRFSGRVHLFTMLGLILARHILSNAFSELHTKRRWFNKYGGYVQIVCILFYVLAVKMRMLNKWWGEQCCRYASVIWHFVLMPIVVRRV